MRHLINFLKRILFLALMIVFLILVIIAIPFGIAIWLITGYNIEPFAPVIIEKLEKITDQSIL